MNGCNFIGRPKTHQHNIFGIAETKSTQYFWNGCNIKLYTQLEMDEWM